MHPRGKPVHVQFGVMESSRRAGLSENVFNIDHFWVTLPAGDIGRFEVVISTCSKKNRIGASSSLELG